MFDGEDIEISRECVDEVTWQGGMQRGKKVGKVFVQVRQTRNKLQTDEDKNRRRLQIILCWCIKCCEASEMLIKQETEN